MALVPTIEPSAPRVGPRVFADVPTQNEVKSANRRGFLFFSAFLFSLGLAVLASIFLFLSLKQLDKQKDDHKTALEKAALTQQETEKRLVDLQARYDKLNQQVGVYYDVRLLSQKIQEKRESIANIATQPGKTGLLKLSQAAVYNNPSVLEPELGRTAKALQKELDGLTAFESFAQEWEPATKTCLTQVNC